MCIIGNRLNENLNQTEGRGGGSKLRNLTLSAVQQMRAKKAKQDQQITGPVRRSGVVDNVAQFIQGEAQPSPPDTGQAYRAPWRRSRRRRAPVQAGDRGGRVCASDWARLHSPTLSLAATGR